MTRAGLLALLAMALLAADPAAPTPLRWPAGRVALGDAVARLEVGGNRVWLGAGVDDRAEAELPAVDGVWWDGVVAVCQAFRVRPDDGDPSDERLDGPGIAVPVGHGTVVLCRGSPPAMQVAGSLLAVVEHDAGIGLWLRAEPRLARGQLAWGRAEDAGLEPAVESFEAQEPQPDSERGLALWHAPEPLPEHTRFHAALRVASLARWNASTPLTAGKDMQIDLDGRTITVVLLTTAEVTTWQGAQLPERRPILAIALPGDLAQNPQLRLRSGEAELAMRNGGGRSGGTDGRQVLLRYPRALAEGPLELQLEGRRPQDMRKLDIRVELPAPGADRSQPPAESPARLAWEAGTAPLSQWLQRLNATGNPVMPEMGVDTAAAITVPAVHGTFWDGVIAVGRAAGLAPAIDPGTGIAGGAVRLVRRPFPPAAACGPFLVVASGIEALPGMVDITLRCLAEPRLPAEGFAAPNAAWASWAEDQDGGAHPCTALPAGPATTQPVQRRNGEEPPPLQARIRLARSGLNRLDLSGMLYVPRVRIWRASVEAAPGQPAEVLLGDRAVEVSTLAAPIQVGGSQWGPGIVVRGLAGAHSLHYAVVGSDGVAPEQGGDANRMGGPAPGRPWLAWCRIPPEGKLGIELAAQAALPPVAVPVRLGIPLPEGL